MDVSLANNDIDPPPGPIPPLTDPTGFERLSLAPDARIPLATGMAFMTGMLLGMSHGGKMAALRFRAENAHRLPTSTKGWYFYHKSKNYNTALQSIKEGTKLGTRIGIWTGAFFTLESLIDWSRKGRKDFLSTTIAGLTLAGLFSAWNRASLMETARIAKLGLGAGLAFGLGQDLLSLARGRRLAYVDFLFRRSRQ